MILTIYIVNIKHCIKATTWLRVFEIGNSELIRILSFQYYVAREGELNARNQSVINKFEYVLIQDWMDNIFKILQCV